MKIDLRKLAHSDTLPFSGTIDLSGEELYGAKPFQSPVVFSGEVTSHLDVLRLTGEVKTTYHTCCARCLKPLEIPLSAEVDVVLSRDPSAEEEDDVFVVEGTEFEVEDVLVPALILQVDMIYLCREDCKGLCPSCGCDLNESVCSCGSKQVDPRMAVLAKLLEGNEGRQD
ncbi:YceD family protein [Butyricicoccus pullicaecorum]|uniref:DUF177 domain-containing protein n=1 Tax=Butyricicoccus pullicaecorum TaxID=501571 RepID=A0A1Y4LMN0_9FIRM|nr:DUF177 domain-containing protein [Butyricicoccus pullicaecorum]MBS5281818.1 DUF177 domain-containing protein [Butyricicoccus pullicaecorum]OUP52595.1 hypothetical protein B5F17_08915 [Butyricicoccus pullicaecorum]OUP57936.1 hypothetical protein B5F15_09025 [Butyricicoccus pullicaecorum]HJF52269.1 DUF177 domain-containing protein [Butyricicoccus pullicaecorum]